MDVKLCVMEETRTRWGIRDAECGKKGYKGYKEVSESSRCIAQIYKFVHLWSGIAMFRVQKLMALFEFFPILCEI